MTSVLMVLTGANTWTMKDGTPHPTGFWSEEFVAPHKTFSDAGFDVSIATPQGRTPTVDPLSLTTQFNHDDPAEVKSQTAYMDSLKSQLDNTRSSWATSTPPTSTSCSWSAATGRCRTSRSIPTSAG